MSAPDALPDERRFGQEDERRFGGLNRLFAAGAQRIRSAHVAVVGIGGVGSWAAEALARSGVARITLVDMDHIAESNINRQLHATTATLGQAKVLAMKERIALIHPECQVHVVDEFASEESWPSIAADGFDALIDACDQVRAKTVLAAWALHTGTPCVSVGAAGGKTMAEGVEVGDLGLLTHDALLAQLRYRLRREHGAPGKGKMGLPCVHSHEAVRRPQASAPDGEVATSQDLNCHGYGSLVSVTATFGMVAAGVVLRALAARRAAE